MANNAQRARIAGPRRQRCGIAAIVLTAAFGAGPACNKAHLGSKPIPDINVDPATVGFGAPPYGIPVTRTLTISNTGTAELTVVSITLVENDGLAEIIATPTGQVGWIIAEGGTKTVTLELTNIDGEQDAGTLLIESNDPDEALLDVALVSEISGDILVGTCVITTSALTQNCVTNPEAIDFGGSGETSSGNSGITEIATSVYTF